MRYLLAIAFVVLVLLGVYYFFLVNKKAPNQKSINEASTIYKYPNSSSWNIDTSARFCFILDFENCHIPVKVNFESNDNWVSIYNYYKTQLISLGWQTNSIIITSIPTSVVFTNDLNCSAELSPSDKSQFSIDVFCKEN